ncbi:hypothetical protein GGX14DRAFT_580179 [Mycena pura]|uniref:Uncharacterized protein n=1 Tax=Mycena pura TaxID=153505 RepID=A0AAD6ULD0_9AGAR|nr:hypothetical protein GGX14DRAFT_580179 [Mycena pura]
MDVRRRFKAADEKREKASTKFFDDTGLMALLCRHDRVLWLVNMRTPSEKQYYIFLLLETFFQHLPLEILVGFLYDIACQSDRSCGKFNFLGRYRDRISWAVSVFHAYGHHWPCQLMYHPLKTIGFGFTNGEGCERFWHSISKLIPYLQVSGYHHRLYTIDTQIEHDDKSSLQRMASWLWRRILHCEAQLREATSELTKCGVPEAELRKLWEEQKEVQTRPLKRRSKNQGMAAVEAILASGKTITLLEKRLDSLEKCLMDPNSSLQRRLYAQENIESTRTAVAREKRKELLLRQQLDVKDRAILNLKDYRPYFTARMSARTLKERIQVKLREHKFEYSIIERSVRRTTSEKKRNDHTSDAIKKREPTIQKLINLYNDECKTIEQLISRRKAPKDSIAPEPLPKKGIFQLDVDDAIWRELGLNDDETTARPRWLLDPKVRDGIRAMLKKDRCGEDSHRLLREREHLQIWFAFEWKVVCELIAITETGPVRYQFETRREELLQLYVQWKPFLDRITVNTGLPPWGPSPADVLAGQVAHFNPSWVREGRSGDSDYSSDEELGEDEDDEYEHGALIDVLQRRENSSIDLDGNDDVFA